MLGLISQIGPINGNSLSQSAGILIGDFWTLTRSQVYRELQVLENRGYIEAGPLGPRASREFSITRDGVRALHDWLDVGPSDEIIRWPMLLTIRFGAFLEPGRLRAIVAEFSRERQAKREYYAELEADMRANNNDPFELATLRFGRLFEGAVEQWLSELPERFPDLFPGEQPPTG